MQGGDNVEDESVYLELLMKELIRKKLKELTKSFRNFKILLCVRM